MSTDIAIRTKGLTKMFRDILAVNALDLEVPKGSIYGFLGLNGAGKTTTIKLLLNIIFPTSGEATVLGCDVVKQSLEVRERVGYVPEEPVIYDNMKVSEVVEFCRSTRKSWDMKVAGRFLDLFELPAGKRVRELSKGMKNQLALTVALGARPELLILDEPTGGLDPVKSRDFLRVIVEQVAESGQTVFFSSHRLDEVGRVADRIGIIHRGRMVFNKAVDDIKTKMKKIRVVFHEEAPVAKIAGLTGVAAVTGQGRGCVVECDGSPGDVMDRLMGFNPVDTEIIDVTLEDVFMKYAGGGGNDR